MNEITLNSQKAIDVTTISNIFIDYYMPAASGSYVKVYIYLLRCLTGNVKNFSISFLADHLDDSEKDIIRALKYWQKVNLLELATSETGEILSITLKEPSALPKNIAAPTVAAAAVTDTITPVKAVSTSEKNTKTPSEDMPSRPEYSNVQIEALKQDEDIQKMMDIVEKYCKRPLKSDDIQFTLYLYESLGFSKELIWHLYEYCIGKHNTHISYMEAIALNWKEAGIQTPDEADAYSIKFNSTYTAVMKAFGLNRYPAEVERHFIDHWIKDFHFEAPIILEACNRSILNTQKGDFKYADKILESWFNSGVKRVADIKTQDIRYNASKKVRSTQNSSTTRTDTVQKPLNHQFNAFPQRNYTAEDYRKIEKQLLKR